MIDHRPNGTAGLARAILRIITTLLLPDYVICLLGASVSPNSRVGSTAARVILYGPALSQFADFSGVRVRAIDKARCGAKRLNEQTGTSRRTALFV